MLLFSRFIGVVTHILKGRYTEKMRVNYLDMLADDRDEH